MFFTGDIRQIEHPYLDSLSNRLSYLVSRMKGQAIYVHNAWNQGEVPRWQTWRAICCRSLLPEGTNIRQKFQNRHYFEVRHFAYEDGLSNIRRQDRIFVDDAPQRCLTSGTSVPAASTMRSELPSTLTQPTCFCAFQN